MDPMKPGKKLPIHLKVVHAHSPSRAPINNQPLEPVRCLHTTLLAYFSSSTNACVNAGLTYLFFLSLRSTKTNRAAENWPHFPRNPWSLDYIFCHISRRICAHPRPARRERVFSAYPHWQPFLHRTCILRRGFNSCAEQTAVSSFLNVYFYFYFLYAGVRL